MPQDLTDAFHDFEQHPETAAMLYHLNSGHLRFTGLDGADSAESTEALRALKKDIEEECLSDEEIEALMRSYLSSQGRGIEGECHKFCGLPCSIDAHHLACGASKNFI